MGLVYSKTNQGAQQVDMKTPLAIIGEVTGIRITKGAHVFKLDALVTKDDIGDIVAGEPFLEVNDVAIRPGKRQIIIRGREIISYESLWLAPGDNDEVELCRPSRSVTVFPNDFISLTTSKETLGNCVVALEPRTMSKVFMLSQWPPVQTVQAIDNEIRVVNNTDSPIFLPKNEQICQVRATHIVDSKDIPSKSSASGKRPIIVPSDLSPPFSKHVIIDPNN